MALTLRVGKDGKRVKQLPLDGPKIQGQNQVWTRIEVKYRPSEDRILARRKWLLLDGADHESGGKWLLSDEAATADIINALSEINKFEDWNYASAWNLCKSLKLGVLHGDKDAADDKARKQQGHLDQEDYVLMERIRNWRIREQEKRLPDNAQALLAFRKLAVRFVERWGQSDLLQYCSDHSLHVSDAIVSKKDLETPVVHRLQAEIHDLEGKAGKLATLVEELVDVEQWEEGDVKSYCRAYALRDPYAESQVPLPLALAVVREHMTEKALGVLPHTSATTGIPQANSKGDIVFKFTAVLNRTSARSLLRAVEQEAKLLTLPRGSTTALFFESSGRGDRLDLTRPLAWHRERDWTDLRLDVTTPERSLQPRHTLTPTIRHQTHPQLEQVPVTRPTLGSPETVEPLIEALYHPLSKIASHSGRELPSNDPNAIRDKYNRIVHDVRRALDLQIPSSQVDLEEEAEWKKLQNQNKQRYQQLVHGTGDGGVPS